MLVAEGLSVGTIAHRSCTCINISILRFGPAMQYLTTVRLAIRNLGRNTHRTAAAVLTVASGVIAFLLAGGYIAWVFQDMREATIHSQLGHIQVVRPGYFQKGVADPYAFLLPAGEAEQQTVAGMDGVVSLTPRLAFSGLVSHGEVTLAFSGEGIDPQRERPLSSRITLLEGKDLDSVDQKAALLGEGLARSLGVRPGDIIVLLTTASNGGASAVEVKVAGIFATITKDYDDHALRLPIIQARKLMRVSGATSWVVLLDGWQRTDTAMTALKSRLPAKDFEIVPWYELSDFYNKTVELFSKQVSVMKVIIGLIIVLTISNTLTMSVLERTTEIGTSLAIGLRNSAVMRLFVLEGALIGVLGGVVGVALGYVMALLISAIGIPMPAAPGMAHGFIGRIVITPGLAIDAVFLAFISTLLASAIPAWKAGRMNIVDALRCSQ
jgi:putative ABC transport system permease protein